MRNDFKLTVKGIDEKDAEKVIAYLKRYAELTNKACFCNITILNLFYNRNIETYFNKKYIDRSIRDIALIVTGNDFPKSQEFVKGLILVGSHYNDPNFDGCHNCGYPDTEEYGDSIYCPCCDTHTPLSEEG